MKKRWWLAMGVDGFRLDVITCLKKKQDFPDTDARLDFNGYVQSRRDRCNVPGMHEILQEMNREVFSRYDIMTVGECVGARAHNASGYINASRKELDSLYYFEISDRITVPEYKAAQTRWAKVVENDCWIAQRLSNHDFPRQVSRFGDDRQYRKESAKLLATLTHTLPIPSQVAEHSWETLLCNYSHTDCLQSKALRPWEAVIFELNQ